MLGKTFRLDYLDFETLYQGADLVEMLQKKHFRALSVGVDKCLNKTGYWKQTKEKLNE